MRRVLALAMIVALSGCTALLVGGSGSGSFEGSNDSRSQAVVMSDTEITTKIRRQYSADPTLRGFSIGIRTHSGAVSLSGTVSAISAKNKAIRIARETEGVSAVNDRILVDD